MTQNTNFGNQMTQKTLFYGFHVDGQKNLKALGEHDPGSAQNGRTSSELWNPDIKNILFHKVSLCGSIITAQFYLWQEQMSSGSTVQYCKISNITLHSTVKWMQCNFETEHYKVALCQMAHCIPQSNECNAILKPNITMQPKIAVQICTQQYFPLASI